MALEISDIFRELFLCGGLRNLPLEQYRVARALISCKTAEAGHHVRSCIDCGHRAYAFNSCANRHCPKCQGGRAFRWVESRCSELLPIGYFHLVFTLPSELRALCYRNKRLLYDALLQCSSEAMQDAALSRYGIRIGSLCVLHTWNQKLSFHPHVHHVVPACGFDSSQLPARLPSGEKFFVSTKVLSRLFRGKFISRVKEFYYRDALRFGLGLEHLSHPANFEQFLSRACRAEWVVYAKRPFASPEAVIKYLASYIHRVGISSRRLLSFTGSEVTFLARSRQDRSKREPHTVPIREFCRRFLLHVLPRGFKRIRYFGFLRNNGRNNALGILRAFLADQTPPVPSSTPRYRCPDCHSHRIRFERIIKTHSLSPFDRSFLPRALNSS